MHNIQLTKRKTHLYLVLFIVPFTFYSCITGGNDDNFVEYGDYVPVILDRDAFENAISFGPPTEMRKSGKIYVKDDLVFINDVNKGFHVYYYETPENPVSIGYLKIPGATDIAIRNNLLYINQAVDLVTMTFDVNQNFEILHRVRNVFPQKTMRNTINYNVGPNEIVVDFVDRF